MCRHSHGLPEVARNETDKGVFSPAHQARSRHGERLLNKDTIRSVENLSTYVFHHTLQYPMIIWDKIPQ